MADIVIKQIEEGMTGRQVADLLYSNFLALVGAIGSGGGGDIPTADIEKGVTAYGWGDHRQAGYLKGITGGMVTGALGYTPMDEAAWTKANIKATLGIADWALAASKPTYTTKEVAEDGNLYFTDARAVAALKSITDGLSGNISTLQGYFTDGVANSALKLSDNGSYTAWGQTFFTNGKPKSVSGALTDVTDITSRGTITTNKIVIGNGTIEWDETNKGFKVTGLYSITYLSAKGANTNGGSTPSGNQYARLDTWDGYTSAMDGWVLSAKLGKGLYDTQNSLISRVGALEGKATNVSFTQSLTSGTQIGTITIDGASKNIYAPTIPTDDINKGVTAYGWGNHASVGYAMASALSGYLPLSGGTLTGALVTVSAKYGYEGNYGLNMNNSDIVGANAIYFGDTSNSNQEGLHFIRSNGNYDTLRAMDGVLMFATNIAAAEQTTSNVYNTVYHTGNLTKSSIGLGNVDNTSDSNKNVNSSVRLRSMYGIDTSDNMSGRPTTANLTFTDKSLRYFLATSAMTEGKPPADSCVLHLAWDNTTWGRQIATGLGEVYYRYQNQDTSWGGWKTFAFLDSNVASATKLATSRKLWGQSFNGENDVNGHLSIGTILGQVAANRAELSIVSETDVPCDLWLGNSAGNVWSINCRPSNENRSFSIFHGSLGHLFRIDGASGDVGIGTINPTQKLHVNGNILIDSGKSLFGSSAAIIASLNGSVELKCGNVNTNSVCLTSAKEFRPFSEAAGAIDLGNSSYRWKNIYGNNIDLKSSLVNIITIRRTAAGGGAFIDYYYSNFSDSQWRVGGGGDGKFMFNKFSGTTETQLVTISADGSMGIGTTSPQYKLDVNGTLHANNTVTFDGELKVGGITSIGATQPQYDGNRAQLSVVSTSNQPAMLWLGSSSDRKWSIESRGEADSYRFSLYSWVASKHRLWIEHSGVATLDGTFNATTGIWSDGYVSAKGQNTSSDMRLKNVLNDVVLSVKDIANAPSMRFSWKNGGGVDVGSSAQYWQKLLPDAVKERDGMLEMQYANIALLSAIALAKNFETHEERIARLERENKELRTKIDMMERRIA